MFDRDIEGGVDSGVDVEFEREITKKLNYRLRVKFIMIMLVVFIRMSNIKPT